MDILKSIFPNNTYITRIYVSLDRECKIGKIKNNIFIYKCYVMTSTANNGKINKDFFDFLNILSNYGLKGFDI